MSLRLPFEELDILVIDEIGKEISARGDGHQGGRTDHKMFMKKNVKLRA